jgi:hypothetical protein
MRRSARRRRGQALVETGIMIVGFLAIALGLVTFGHAMAVANMISHAARDGARIAATWPNRGPCGDLTPGGYTDLTDQVKRDIAAVIGDTSGLNVVVTQTPTLPSAAPCDRAETQYISVNVNGCVPYLFPIIPLALGTNCGGKPGFSVNTTQILIDE